MANADSTVFDINSQESIVELFGEREARWCQVASRNAVEQAFKANPMARILLIQPTGCGKTMTNGMIMLSDTVRNILTRSQSRPLRVLFIAHVHRLLTQAERAYAVEADIRTITMENRHSSSMVRGNLNYVPCKTEIFYQSMQSDIPTDMEFDLVVQDEGHHEPTLTQQHKLKQIGHLPAILMTATGNRLDRMLIKADVVVESITREQAVAEGFLARSSLHTFVDCSGRNKAPILSDILTNFSHMMGQTLAFVRTHAEAEIINKVLLDQGHNSVVLMKQSKKEVNSILDQFSEGKINFIVNCNKLGEGIDVQGCESVVIGRQLDSYILLNQIIGRSARPDSDSRVWELVNPLSGTNLDSTVVVGTPEEHILYSKERGAWVQRKFDYTSHSYLAQYK